MLASIFIGIIFGMVSLALWFGLGILLVRYRYRWLAGTAIIAKLMTIAILLWLFVIHWRMDPIGFLGGVSVIFVGIVIAMFCRTGRWRGDGRI